MGAAVPAARAGADSIEMSRLLGAASSCRSDCLGTATSGTARPATFAAWAAPAAVATACSVRASTSSSLSSRPELIRVSCSRNSSVAAARSRCVRSCASRTSSRKPLFRLVTSANSRLRSDSRSTFFGAALTSCRSALICMTRSSSLMEPRAPSEIEPRASGLPSAASLGGSKESIRSLSKAMTRCCSWRQFANQDRAPESFSVPSSTLMAVTSTSCSRSKGGSSGAIATIAPAIVGGTR
mmetsp:Transcript_65157/g.187286  ORF Transcript_65157/g.187286 Transcript_65157/m.187286 type:complete len:240 (+) Transcript_65157:3255-3974(+)